MHLTFDWNAARRRSREQANSAEEGQGANRTTWKRFPYGDRIYRYGGTALSSNWARLHRGDLEPYPTTDSLAELLGTNPELMPHAPDLAAIVALIEDAWRAYHAGDFADAVDYGLAAGPVGMVVAARAAAVYASHLEEDEVRRLAILRDTVESCAALVQLAPNWINAWYVYGLALGRYSQNISVVKALAQGLGGKVRDSLHRVIQLNPGHADAHVGLGVYHAEVIDKVGGMVAALTYGARKEAVVDHFEAARGLHPQSPVVLAEYARSTQLAFGHAHSGRAHEIFGEAAACQPADALERLDVEWALGELE
ncbi:MULTISPECIES: hypothetical protein [Zoogloea]|jgi:hypothetical protein|uniref:hypothetical protein n=1 Tax=Zoogloea TaxID=349 RepID=UPI001CA34234|nr:MULTISPECIES: hypothetical protein [Zoogloea]MDD2668395.1 hypothetical protein [Zoogloea sp.]MDY0035173.1 hypothetical protein [Zoogloea oleivorans]